MESTITVQNIKCGGCASTITSKLSELEDITDVSVDVVSGTVSFETTNKDGIQELKNKLKSLGYPARTKRMDWAKRQSPLLVVQRVDLNKVGRVLLPKHMT